MHPFKKFVLSMAFVGLVAGVGACGDDDDPVTDPPPDDAPTIAMTAPAGGAAVMPGSAVTISWTATDDNAVTGVDLSYTADGVAETAIASDVAGASYDWTTPAGPLYGVVVKGVAKDASNQTAEDETTDIFAVVEFSAAGYVQGVTCGDCHPSYYTEVYEMSGHPYKLNKVDGAAPSYPNGPGVPNPPAGYTWDDVTYVIGGYGWKARYIGTDGYIITPAAGLNQWNLLWSIWTDYHPGEVRPYNCGSCHTTGWVDSDDGDATNNQDGLEGLVGTFEEQGIGCEQCHGAGAMHVSTQSASDISIDSSDDLCGTCHQRGGANANIPASGGAYIQHHEQYNEFANSAHFGVVGCNDCHDPHLGTRYDMGGYVEDCTSCHAEQTANNAHVPVFGSGDAGCITCHLSQATKSAVADQTNLLYVGDVQTHIFTINPDPVGKDYFFSADGLSVATADEGVTLDFACYQCHKDDLGEGGPNSMKSLAELSAKATGIHAAP
jgi:hypothetical protein